MGFQLAQHPFDDVVLPVNVARLAMTIIAGVVGGSMGEVASCSNLCLYQRLTYCQPGSVVARRQICQDSPHKKGAIPWIVLIAILWGTFLFS